MSIRAFLSKRLEMFLPALLAWGCALYAWALTGGLGWGTPAQIIMSLSAAVLFLFVWVSESLIFARFLSVPLSETRRKVLLSLIPFIVFPVSSPYISHRVFSSFFNGDISVFKLTLFTLWLLFLAVAGSIGLKLVIFWPRAESSLATVERHAVKILWAGTALYFIAFVALAFLAYSQFRYHSDLAQYNQTLWATLRGDIFYSSLEETSGSYLSTHVSPFLLLLLPVYALKQSPLTILFLRSLALALAAIPLFYCVRRITGSAVAGLFLSAAYLFNPEIVSQHFTSGYEVVFVAAFFFAAFYFFMQKRFGLFILFLILTVMVREDFVPAAFVFALYALIKRMPLRWILAPLFLGITAQAVVMIIFNATIEHWVFNLYYGHFGSSPTEMVGTIVNHPVYAAEETWSLHRSYLYDLLMPVGFVLPWASLVSIFALPNLAIILARSADFTAVGGITHYSVLVVSALWLGLAGFIGKVQNWTEKSKRSMTAVGISIVIVILAGASVHIWSYNLPRGNPVDAAALNNAIAIIPEDASVASNDGRIFPRLSSRWEIYEPLIWDILEEPDRVPQGIDQLQRAEFVILKPFGNPFYNDEKTFAFVSQPGSPYHLIFDEDGIRIFRKES